MTSHRAGLAGVLVAVGGLGIVVQVVLIREVMAAFAGNELTVGIVLGVWIACEALGALLLGTRWLATRAKKALVWTALMSIAVSLAAVPGLILVRPLLGLVPAETPSPLALVAAMLPILILPAFTHGGLFSLGVACLETSSSHQPGGVAYLWEGLGSVLAASIFSFWLIARLSSLMAVVVFAIPLVLTILLIGPRHLRLLLGLLALCLLFTAAGPADRLENWVWSRHWPGQRVLAIVNSHYGKVTRLAREDQGLVLFNGVPVLALPQADPGRIEELIHLPLLAHPSPERLLILGQALGGGVGAALQEPLTRLVTVQLDPVLIRELRAAGGPVVGEELGDPRVTLIIADPRRYLLQTTDSFDCIIMTDAVPHSLSANRLFTREFFELCRNRLRPGGVIATPLPGTGCRLSSDAAAILAVRKATLAQVFTCQEVLAADFPLILASDRAITLAAETLVARLQERRLTTRVLTPDYLRQLLNPLRQRLLQSPTSPNPKTAVNHDQVPVELLLNMLRESRLASSGFAAFYQRLVRNLASPTLLIVLAMLVILAGVLGGRSLGRPFANRFVILTSGYAGAALSTLLLLGFQLRFGSLYSQVALLLAAFMLGTVLGSGLGIGVVRTAPAALGTADAILVLIAGLMPLLTLHGTGPWFVIATGSTGICLGAQFSLAAAHQPRFGKVASRNAGTLFALDLLGGFVGSLATALVLMPVLGLVSAALAVAVVKAASLLSQLLARPAATKSPFDRRGFRF
ncbi:MAG: hypothetical protein ABIK44_05745 [candidate division WOR-3 bacterium]